MPNKRARDVSSFRTYRVLISLGIIYAAPHYSPFVVSAFSLTACTILALIFIRAGKKRRIGV